MRPAATEQSWSDSPEAATNRGSVEITDALASLRHVILGDAPPAGAGGCIEDLTVDAGELASAREYSVAIAQEYEGDLRETYEYSLVQHNCATELRKTIESTFSDEDSAVNMLNHTIFEPFFRC